MSKTADLILALSIGLVLFIILIALAIFNEWKYGSIKLFGSLRNKPEYAIYAHKVNKLIKEALDRDFRGVAEGHLHLSIIIDKNGEIEKIDYDEVKNYHARDLIESIIEVIRKLAPFPPFPKKLTLPSLGFYMIYPFKKSA